MQTAEKGGAADEAPSVKACLVYDSHTKNSTQSKQRGEACGDFYRAPTQTQAGTRPPPAQSQSTRRGSVLDPTPAIGPDSLVLSSILQAPGSGPRKGSRRVSKERGVTSFHDY